MTAAPAPPYTRPGTGSSGPVRQAGAPDKRHPWRIVGWIVGGLLLAGLILAAAALTRTSQSGAPLGPDNPGRFGAQAVARVLERQGVSIETVTSPRAALRAAGAGDTLFVADDGSLLTDGQIERLSETAADVVLVAPNPALLDAMTDGHVSVSDYTLGSVARSADCRDPDARAAETIDTQLVFGTDGDAGVTLCFPGDGQAGESGSYAVYATDTRTVRAFSTPYAVTNDEVDQEGNAALVLRALGHHEKLVWLIPDGEDDAALPSLVPAAFWPIMLLLVAVVAALALWRGRRLGRLVTEPLPVIVRASETVRGRGRLYRAGRSRGHAAAGLRAGAAERISARLGLPRSTTPAALVAAISQATGRPETDVADALYGAPPGDDAALGALAHTLDQIESEVYHS